MRAKKAKLLRRQYKEEIEKQKVKKEPFTKAGAYFNPLQGIWRNVKKQIKGG